MIHIVLLLALILFSLLLHFIFKHWNELWPGGTHYRITKFVALSTVGVFGLCTIALMWLNWAPALPTDSKDTYLLWQLRGQRGDAYGPLNALFAGLAFLGVTFSLAFQFLEALERSRERSNDVYEARLFRMLEVLRSLVEGMEINWPHGGKTSGRGVFTAGVKRLRTQMKKAEKESLPRNLQSLMVVYKSHFTQNLDDLAPYFRLLYRIIVSIDRSHVRQREKETFSKIVRAEFSGSEVVLLAINGLTDEGSAFKPLIEKYHLLKHFPEGDAYINHGFFYEEYDASAFNDPDERIESSPCCQTALV